MNIDKLKAFRTLVSKLIAAQRECDRGNKGGFSEKCLSRRARKRDELYDKVSDEACDIFGLRLAHQPDWSFSLGEYLQEEMGERGWDVAEVARRAHLYPTRLEVILGGADADEQELASLASAFDVSETLFRNLQNNYKARKR